MAVIYYFSGTGNSLVLARDLAVALDARLISIPVVMDQDKVLLEADVVGLVFPVYHGGLPLVLQRFVAKLDLLAGKYLFGVCTYGGSPGLALRDLERLVRAQGGVLAARFGLQMPFNYITPPLTLRGFFRRFTLREIPGEKRQGMFATEKARIPEIAARVRARASVGLDVTIDPITRMVDRLHLKETLGKKVWLKIAGIDEPTRLSFLESRQLMDHGFHADENCIECGICVQVCPVSNIEMVDGRPAWHHRCEQCFACLQWCPQEALQFREGTVGKWRYHHPEVALRDMVQSAPSR